MKLLMLLLISSSAFSATSGTLLLKGTVPSILSVSVSPEAIAANLPLELSQTNLKVATVTERSNNLSGYKITITSANAGKMEQSSSSYVAYTLTYGGNSINLSSPTVLSNAFASAAPVSRDVKISYVGAEIAGDYSDTLTFTIGAN